MNILELVGRVCLSFGIASILSIVISAIVLGSCWLLVYAFKLNYGSDAYWAINISLTAMYISWIIGFAYCIKVIK